MAGYPTCDYMFFRVNIHFLPSGCGRGVAGVLAWNICVSLSLLTGEYTQVYVHSLLYSCTSIHVNLLRFFSIYLYIWDPGFREGAGSIDNMLK